MESIRFFVSLAGCLFLLSATTVLRAEGFPSCSLGRVTERVAPQYPLGLDGRIVEGIVQVQANFAPDGRVTSSKVISGPAALRSESEAYIHGWRAEKSEELRACVVSSNTCSTAQEAFATSRTRCTSAQSGSMKRMSSCI